MLAEAQRGQLGASSALDFQFLSMANIGLGAHCNILSLIANIFADTEKHSKASTTKDESLCNKIVKGDGSQKGYVGLR